MVKKINENYEATKKVTEHPKTDEAQNLLELERLEAERIMSEHEGEQYTYNDLSTSEKLIYHFPITDYLTDFKAQVQQFKLIA